MASASDEFLDCTCPTPRVILSHLSPCPPGSNASSSGRHSKYLWGKQVLCPSADSRPICAGTATVPVQAFQLPGALFSGLPNHRGVVVEGAVDIHLACYCLGHLGPMERPEASLSSVSSTWPQHEALTAALEGRGPVTTLLRPSLKPEFSRVKKVLDLTKVCRLTCTGHAYVWEL